MASLAEDLHQGLLLPQTLAQKQNLQILLRSGRACPAGALDAASPDSAQHLRIGVSFVFRAEVLNLGEASSFRITVKRNCRQELIAYVTIEAQEKNENPLSRKFRR